jgi:hypothetical protein
MTIITSHNAPAAWRGRRRVAHTAESALLLVLLLLLLLGAFFAALITGRAVDLTSVPWLQLYGGVAGG